MENMYLPGVPELHLKNYQMSHLIRQKCPQLFNHLKKIQMTTDYFTSKWIMTVFANSLPFDTIPFIFDNLLQDGWTSVYRIGIAILRKIQPELLQMDMFEITKYLRDSVRNDKVNIHQLLMSAEAISIYHEDIEHYKEKFIIEQAEVKLKLKNEELIKENKDAVNWAHEIFEKTEPHAKQDIMKFQDKIESIEREIKGQEKIMFAWKMEYDDVKEQFQQHRDSKKGTLLILKSLALEGIYEQLKTSLDSKKKKSKSKFRRLFGKTSKKGKAKADEVSFNVKNSNNIWSGNPYADSAVPSTVKHTSGKAKNLQVKFDDNMLSENETEEASSKPKSRFGFTYKSKKIKRSNSNVGSGSLKDQEIFQMEQDLLAIELKIWNSENLKNMIQEDYYQK